MKIKVIGGHKLQATNSSSHQEKGMTIQSMERSVVSESDVKYVQHLALHSSLFAPGCTRPIPIGLPGGPRKGVRG